MARILCSQRDLYTFTKLYRLIYTCSMQRTIYQISTYQAECKDKYKGSVLHNIWRLFCVSREVMFRTLDSNGPASSMLRARTYSTKDKRQILGFSKLRNLGRGFFFIWEIYILLGRFSLCPGCVQRN